MRNYIVKLDGKKVFSLEAAHEEHFYEKIAIMYNNKEKFILVDWINDWLEDNDEKEVSYISVKKCLNCASKTIVISEKLPSSFILSKMKYVYAIKVGGEIVFNCFCKKEKQMYEYIADSYNNGDEECPFKEWIDEYVIDYLTPDNYENTGEIKKEPIKVNYKYIRSLIKKGWKVEVIRLNPLVI